MNISKSLLLMPVTATFLLITSITPVQATRPNPTPILMEELLDSEPLRQGTLSSSSLGGDSMPELRLRNLYNMVIGATDIEKRDTVEQVSQKLDALVRQAEEGAQLINLWKLKHWKQDGSEPSQNELNLALTKLTNTVKKKNALLKEQNDLQRSQRQQTISKLESELGVEEQKTVALEQTVSTLKTKLEEEEQKTAEQKQTISKLESELEVEEQKTVALEQTVSTLKTKLEKEEQKTAEQKQTISKLASELEDYVPISGRLWKFMRTPIGMGFFAGSVALVSVFAMWRYMKGGYMNYLTLLPSSLPLFTYSPPTQWNLGQGLSSGPITHTLPENRTKLQQIWALVKEIFNIVLPKKEHSAF